MYIALSYVLRWLGSMYLCVIVLSIKRIIYYELLFCICVSHPLVFIGHSLSFLHFFRPCRYHACMSARSRCSMTDGHKQTLRQPIALLY